MPNYDVIVCGAGPAGAVAAATVATTGLRVALLEKHRLPRHKTCGGGTPMVMQSVLQDLVPEAVVECDVRYMRHTWNFDNSHLAAINPPGVDRALSIWMMQRSIFDNALAQRATQAGAELLDGMAVRAIEVEATGVRVRAHTTTPDGERTKGAEWSATARYVIGADGANGITAKAANLSQNRSIALAMEVEYPHQWGQGHPDLRPDVAHLEYGAVPRGYAWVFPKADHLNIGAGVFRPSQGNDARRDRLAREQLRIAIVRYLQALQVKCDPTHLQFHAHPLPIWNGKQRLHTADGRILLAGDAAGLINPLFGDGILHAVKSGAIAATCIATNTTQTYSDRIHAEFAPNFDAALQLARLFYQYPGVCYKYGVKHAKGTRLATQLLAGELAFSDITGRALGRLRSAIGGNLLSFPKLGN